MCCLLSKWHFYANTLCCLNNTRHSSRVHIQPHSSNRIIVLSLLGLQFFRCSLSNNLQPALRLYALVKIFTYFVVLFKTTNKKMRQTAMRMNFKVQSAVYFSHYEKVHSAIFSLAFFHFVRVEKCCDFFFNIF